GGKWRHGQDLNLSIRPHSRPKTVLLILARRGPVSQCLALEPPQPINLHAAWSCPDGEPSWHDQASVPSIPNTSILTQGEAWRNPTRSGVDGRRMSVEDLDSPQWSCPDGAPPRHEKPASHPYQPPPF